MTQMANDKKRPTVKILENWARIEEFEQLIQKQTGDPEARFNANLFFWGNGGRPLLLSCKYRKAKKNGGFTDKYFEVDVMAEYCPITGQPLYEEKNEGGDQ